MVTVCPVPRVVAPLTWTVSVFAAQFHVLAVFTAFDGPTVATTFPFAPSTLLPVMVVSTLPLGPMTAVVCWELSMLLATQFPEVAFGSCGS